MEIEFVLQKAREDFIRTLNACGTLRTFTPSEVVTRTGLRFDQVRDLITAASGCFVRGSIDGNGEQCYFVTGKTEPTLNSLLATLRRPIS